MKVADSAIQFYTQHTSFEEHEQNESLTILKNGEEVNSVIPRKGQISPLQTQAAQLAEKLDSVTLSPEVINRQPVEEVTFTDRQDDDLIGDLNIRILVEMIERFTGKKIHITKSVGAIENVSLKHVDDKGVDNPGRTIGLIYDSYESHHEYEKQTFAAEGVVVTSDGEEINITLELSMSREFFTEESVSIRAGEALKDPLVINFDGSAAELTTQQFAFDIDKDGTTDQISFVSPQSGFLALDRNKDNIINDGTELFGAITGDGFHELSLGDDDNNNWIDENDSIYDQLRIWRKSENGEDSLLALGESGVGAIYLGNIASPFSLKNEENELLGQIRTSGVFLSDEGRVGTIQQVDLVV